MTNNQNIFPSETHSIKTGCGDMYVHILYSEKNTNEIKQVRATLGKSGGCARSHLESKVAIINSVIKNLPTNIAILALTEACGHTCNVERTCHDLMIRLVIEELMKIK